MSIETNQLAPNFKLFNTEKKEINLYDQNSKNVVLLFFPLAFTSTCTAELCYIRDNYNIYEKLNAVIFGISIDSVYTLAKFKEEQKLNFDLLSDFNKTASKLYNCLYEKFGVMSMQGVSKRSAFVIDKNSIVKYAEVLENASEQPNYDAIKKCLDGLQ